MNLLSTKNVTIKVGSKISGSFLLYISGSPGKIDIIVYYYVTLFEPALGDRFLLRSFKVLIPVKQSIFLDVYGWG